MQVLTHSDPYSEDGGAGSQGGGQYNDQSGVWKVGHDDHDLHTQSAIRRRMPGNGIRAIRRLACSFKQGCRW